MKKNNLDRFLGFLDVPAKALIGVDISTSSIKVVELSRKRNGQLCLENYAIEPTPKEVFDNQGVPTNNDALSASLERAWKKLGSKIKNIAIALPTNSAIAKRAHFSKEFDDDLLEDEVLMEANQHIPFPIEEVNIDWHIVGPYQNNPDAENEVLICAARKDRINEFEAVAEGAGLRIQLVDVESFSQQRAFYQLAASVDGFHERVVALADAGSSMLTINIFNRGQVIFTKEIPFGANQLTDSLVGIYQITPEQAEEAKRKNGAGLANYNDQALRPFLESMAMEINRALQFFLTQASVERIDTIVLAGGCASFERADQIVADVSQIETLVANPFAKMEISGRAKNKPLLQEAPLLLTACGLALRRFD